MTKTDVQNDLGSTAGAGSLPANPAAVVPHSALPWRQNAKEPTLIEADETENGAPYSFVIAEAVIYGAKPSDEELANAAFIVRACNAHADLLANAAWALGMLRALQPKMAPTSGPGVEETIASWEAGMRDLRAALALAEPSST